MTKKQLEKQIKNDFVSKYSTFTGRLATAMSQEDTSNLLISKTIIWTTLLDLLQMTEKYKDIFGDTLYEHVHKVRWRFPKNKEDIQQMINEIGLIIE